MASSSKVAEKDIARYTQYNDLRDDVLDTTTGHDHTGAADHGKKVDHGDLLGLADDDHTQYYKIGREPDHGALGGLADDDHTQYVLRNILTTHGDIFFRDASAVVRLAPGISGEFLKTQGSGQNPVWAGIPSGVTFNTTQVFSGTSPTTFTDLDLSGVVGANSAVVLLKVLYNGTTTSDQVVAFRKYGETVLGGSSHVVKAADYYRFQYFLVPTDAGGIVEWRAGAAESYTITMEAYWK